MKYKAVIRAYMQDYTYFVYVIMIIGAMGCCGCMESIILLFEWTGV